MTRLLMHKPKQTETLLNRLGPNYLNIESYYVSKIKGKCNIPLPHSSMRKIKIEITKKNIILSFKNMIFNHTLLITE